MLVLTETEEDVRLMASVNLSVWEHSGSAVKYNDPGSRMVLKFVMIKKANSQLLSKHLKF